jgi:sortase A
VALAVSLLAVTSCSPLRPSGVASAHRHASDTVAPSDAALSAACAAGGGTTTTTNASGATTGVQGVLQIPSIGLVAPVEQGVDDPELNVAVGHLTDSVWPGEAGNSVLEAHDVSYFVHLDRLKTGDLVRYSTPCVTDVFAVQVHNVVEQGSPVYDTTDPSITLITCWPTNALWYTTQRYLVSATHLLTVSRSAPGGIGTGAGAQNLSVPSSAVPPTVPAPAALAAQGLDLSTNSLPMGPLTISGDPSNDWVQGPGPLAVEGSAVKGFFAGVKSLTQDRSDWWSAVAPGVAMPAAMVGHQPGWTDKLSVTITAQGTTPSTVQLADGVSVGGGSYHLVVTESVRGSTMVVSGWQLTPA